MTLYDNHCAACGKWMGRSNRSDADHPETCLKCKAEAGDELARQILKLVPVCSCCGKRHT